MRHRVSAILLALAPALSGCAPRFEVPVPLVSSATAVVPPGEPATIALPIAIAMTRLRATLDTAFPAVDSLDRARCQALGGLVCHQYVYRRDTLDVRMRSDRLSLFTRLRYRGRVALPGVGSVASCGYAPEAMKHAEARLVTTLYWRADWRIGARGTELEAVLPDRCEVTALRVDATPVMQRVVDGQLARVRQQVDSAIPAVTDLRPVAESLWTAMQRPIALDSAGSAWLAMAPGAVSLAPLAGTGNTISTGIVLTAHPRVVIGARPAVPVVPLPSLTVARPGPGIHVPVRIELPFADVSARATQLLGGEIAGKGISVRDVKLWGVGDTAVVRVGIAGRVHGALYLLGRIAYDTALRTVLIRDLRYTLASDDAMSRIKATLGAGRIRHGIEEATGHGRLAVGPQLDSLRMLLSRQLTRPLAAGLELHGGVTDVRVAGLTTTQTAFVLRVVLDGQAVVVVR